MSRQTDLYGVEKIVIRSLDKEAKTFVFNDIREDTAKFSQSKGELTKIFSETNRSIPYRVFSNPGDGVKVEFSIYANFEQMKFLMGGSFDETSYTPPSSLVDIYREVKIYTRKTDSSGSFMIITLPYACLQAGIEGSLKHNDIGYLEVVAMAMKRKEEDLPFILKIIKGVSSESAQQGETTVGSSESVQQVEAKGSSSESVQQGETKGVSSENAQQGEATVGPSENAQQGETKGVSSENGQQVEAKGASSENSQQGEAKGVSSESVQQGETTVGSSENAQQGEAKEGKEST